VNCALALDTFAQDFVQRQLRDRGLEVGITRIGVNSGIATIGNFGGTSFFDYTAHGDMVNAAARLEGANKHLGTRMCVSAETASKCPERNFRPVGSLVLKGKHEGIEVFEPISPERAASATIAAYNQAFELMKDGKPGALEAFEMVLEADGTDPLARFHLARLKKGEAGARIVMDEK
jgi:class 3 adenylate cyclase